MQNLNANRRTLFEQPQRHDMYLGERGRKFKQLISGLLLKGNVKKQYIDILTDRDGMNAYASAFTSELVDSKNNYQVYEQLGDLIGNQFIVHYAYRRFPALKCAEGVEVVARLRINYGSKQSFSKIALNLGFWPFISAPNETRLRKMEPLLEDVFEAFLGVTCDILDERTNCIGVGHGICYRILKSIFDGMDISLMYEDLYDSKTRLKELFDQYEMKGDDYKGLPPLGPLKYENTKIDRLNKCVVYRIQGGQYPTDRNGNIIKKRIVGGTQVKIGEGTSSLKDKAQKSAARSAISNLKRMGYIKQPPAIYRKLAGENIGNSPRSKRDIVTKYTIVDEETKSRSFNINALQSTLKAKHSYKYQSTLLSLYCRKRDVDGVRLCLEMKANPNIIDTNGMNCLELLFLNSDIDEDLVLEILQLLIKGGVKLEMQKEIYDMYYVRYISEFFINLNIQEKNMNNSN